jgi:hypothetical protein
MQAAGAGVLVLVLVLVLACLSRPSQGWHVASRSKGLELEKSEVGPVSSSGMPRRSTSNARSG